PMTSAPSVDRSAARHGTRALTAAPFIVTAVFVALLAWRPTRHFTVDLTDENGPVELGTFLLLLIAAGQAWMLTHRLRRAGQRRLALSRWPLFDAVSAPPRILWAWFTVITSFAAADLFCDYRELDTPFAKAMDVMSEVVELMIAASAMLYLWMKGREATLNV